MGTDAKCRHTMKRTRRLAKAYLLCRLSLVHCLNKDFAFWLDRTHRKTAGPQNQGIYGQGEVLAQTQIQLELSFI